MHNDLSRVVFLLDVREIRNAEGNDDEWLSLRDAAQILQLFHQLFVNSVFQLCRERALYRIKLRRKKRCCGRRCRKSLANLRNEIGSDLVRVENPLDGRAIIPLRGVGKQSKRGCRPTLIMPPQKISACREAANDK